MNEHTLAETWRAIITGTGKSWVVFEHGTCVILMEPGDDLERQATELLAEWGPVHGGSPAGDFTVITLAGHRGWAVTSHHRDILTYVDPDEVDAGTDDLRIGLLGRSKRAADASELNAVHVEDGRTKA